MAAQMAAASASPTGKPEVAGARPFAQVSPHGFRTVETIGIGGQGAQNYYHGDQSQQSRGGGVQEHRAQKTLFAFHRDLPGLAMRKGDRVGRNFTPKMTQGRHDQS